MKNGNLQLLFKYLKKKFLIFLKILLNTVFYVFFMLGYGRREDYEKTIINYHDHVDGGSQYT